MAGTPADAADPGAPDGRNRYSRSLTRGMRTSRSAGTAPSRAAARAFHGPSVRVAS